MDSYGENVSVKLTECDHSEKSFLSELKFCPARVICPYPGDMYKNMENASRFSFAFFV